MKRIGPGLLLFTAYVLGAQQPFAASDLWAWRTVTEVRISADGSQVVYVEGWDDQALDRHCANLWLVGVDGKGRRRLTEGAWGDSGPQWSPDNKIIEYLSDRGGKQRLRVRRLDTEQDTEIASGDYVPLNIAWSPDGNSLAFTARVPVKPAPVAWAPPSILPLLLTGAASYTQVFMMPTPGGAPRQITSGEFNYGEPAWMPDGESILATRDGGDIFAFRWRDGAAKQLTKAAARCQNPVPSPDGSKIAYVAAEAKPQSYVVRKLYVMSADGSRARVLAGALDRDVTAPQWSSDSRTVYFLADDRGASHVYAARNDGSVRQATTARQRLHDFSLADNGRAATVRSPGEVITFPVDRPGDAVRLAAPNENLLAQREVGAVEEIDYPSDGKTIQAWAVKPPGFDGAKKYPLLLDIKDTPRSMCGVEFRLRAQIFAARGFVVLCANPRGAPGYGEEFGNLIHSRFPGDDYDDLMRGVDAVAAKGYVDTERLTVAGGLLAAWTIGHTDRFRAAVARHAIMNWVTDVATADDGAYRASAWMGAMPWESPEQYVKRSPIFFAGNFKTPTLVIAGERDPESEELYFALQSRKVESAMLRLGTGKPSAQVLEMEAALAWLRRFVGVR